MKVYSKNMDLLNNIKAELERRKKEYLEKTAGEDEPTLEEAIEHAKNYWMMGYSWDEVEVVLEDMEFSKNLIDKAVEEAEKYAKEVHEKGPFSKLKEGQLIKLKNSYFGVLASKNAKDIEIIGSDDEALRVSDKDVDFEATGRLEEAYTLRASANEILKFANKAPEITKTASVRKEGFLSDFDLIKTKKDEIDKDILEAKQIIKECNTLQGTDKNCVKKLASASGYVLATMNEIDERLLQKLGSLLLSYEKVAKEEDQGLKDLIGPTVAEIKNLAFVWSGEMKPIIEDVKNQKTSSDKYNLLLRYQNGISSCWDKIKESSNKINDMLLENISEASNIIESYVKKVNFENKEKAITASLRKGKV